MLQLLHQVANFTAAHGIQTRHRFVKEKDFRVVKNGLRDPYPLQHALGKLAQLHSSHIGQPYPLQDFNDLAAALFRITPESCP